MTTNNLPAKSTSSIKASGASRLISPLLSPEQAAEQLGIPYRRLYAWKSEGKGPKFVQIGRSLRYRQSDLAEYIEAHIFDPADL